MNCLRPIHLKEYPYSAPCGRCEACLSNKANDWVTRLRAETQAATSAFFITLTYEDHFLPKNKNGNPGFSLKDMQRFIQNLRNKVPDPIRYYYVCEYGDPDKGYRPHYHMCLWNWPPEVDLMTACGKSWVDSKGRMMSIWLPEMVKPLVTEHILYVTKYIHKKALVKPGYDKPFMRCSRRPGIGAQLLTDVVKKFYHDTPSHQIYIDGEQYYMPRYYKDKIYNDPESKQALLASKIRYVNIKMSKQVTKDLRQRGVAEEAYAYLDEHIDYSTGEVKYEIRQPRPRPVGLLERSGLLVDAQIAKRKAFVNKKNKIIKDSYQF